jgi:hypothetical protein
MPLVGLFWARQLPDRVVIVMRQKPAAVQSAPPAKADEALVPLRETP